jgi:hypothetical protein
MKIIKKALHYWFAVVSVLSFLAGWGMLAHSLKPIQPVSLNNSTLLNLPPIQAYTPNSQNGGGSNFPVSNMQSNAGFPRLRSGGS